MNKKTSPLMTAAEYGAFKRIWECFGADSLWREKFLAHPADVIKKFPEITDVYAAFKAVGMLRGRFLGLKDLDREGVSPYYDEYIRRYESVKAYLSDRFRAERFADARLFRWNEIALRRARMQVSELRNTPTVRFFPLIFELSAGCRQQCPFCGLAAAEHRKDFLAVPEHRKLWREVLAASREALGDIAADAACYFATEPLDNPDYEELLGEFAQVMGNFPQTTTVLAAREPERIRSLMKRIGRERMGLAALRFSTRTLAEFRRVMEEYAPEELADVEILPQNPESGTTVSLSGRLYGTDPPPGKAAKRYSISCVAGFRVNMAEQSVAFMEPTLPSDEYPTGVHIRAERKFESPMEYRNILEEFAKRFALDTLPDDLPLALAPAVTVEERESFLLLRGDGISMKLGGNLQVREAVKGLARTPRTFAEICRALGVGDFVGRGLRQKLQILYEKGYLCLV